MVDIRVYLPVNRSYKINIEILKHLMIDLTCMIHDPARYCEIIIICGIPIFVDIVDPQIYPITVCCILRGGCGRDRSWIYNYLCNQYLSPLTL
jgi:hypothetical protein